MSRSLTPRKRSSESETSIKLENSPSPVRRKIQVKSPDRKYTPDKKSSRDSSRNFRRVKEVIKSPPRGVSPPQRKTKNRMKSPKRESVDRPYTKPRSPKRVRQLSPPLRRFEPSPKAKKHPSLTPTRSPSPPQKRNHRRRDKSPINSSVRSPVRSPIRSRPKYSPSPPR